ncbi:MAG: L-histidine N(alpha)-methyltransferase [Cytophagales bacterium]
MANSKEKLTQFAQEVHSGLSNHPKRLPSKYFYNEKGDKLFQAIMASPEYYLTRSEFEIFNSQSEKIAGIFSDQNKAFDLIELGAGDGTKTKVLLQNFVKKDLDFTYMPIDISKHVIAYLEKHVKKDIPKIRIKGIVGDYFEKLHDLQMNDKNRKVVLFLGSNIGNFKKGKDVEFLRLIAKNLNKGDLLMIGFDLVKDPNIIRRAYNDSQGATREFNLNLLDRINEELGANFQRENFLHYPIYDPVEKQARSYIVSKKDQEVFIEAIDRSYPFKAWEFIHTEISQKYSKEDIEHLASASGFSHKEFLFDCKHYYTDAIWEK